jgi:hypothetical protein
MTNMLGGKDAPKHLPIYLAPLDVAEPRVMARLDEDYMLSPKEAIDGFYTVIGQVDQLLESDEEISVIRVIRDVPPTPLEVTTISEALSHFIEPAKKLGVDVSQDDLSVRSPSVMLRPIAVFR